MGTGPQASATLLTEMRYGPQRERAGRRYWWGSGGLLEEAHRLWAQTGMTALEQVDQREGIWRGRGSEGRKSKVPRLHY